MERVRTINFKGRRIVVVDMTDCVGEEYAQVLEDGAAFIRREPLGSALLATVVTRGRFGRGAADRVRAYSAAIRPHLRAGAVVGLSALQRVLFTSVRPFLHSTVKDFASLDGALDWLVELDAKARPPA
jgi:hypothetical protein